MKKFNLKEYFVNNLLVVKYLGLWPKTDYNSDKLYLLYAIIVNGFFNLSISIGMIVYILTSSSPLEDVVGAAYFMLGVMATVKSFFIMRYSKMFKFLAETEVHKTLEINLTENQNKILCDYVGLWKILHLTLSYLSVVMFINYISLPMFSKTPYTLPLRSWYPFDYKKPVVYELVYFHQIITVWVDIFVNTNGATLVAGFLAYLSAECDVLVDMLRNLNTEKMVDKILDVEALKMCIEYHKKIVEYSKLVEEYLSKYLLVQFSSSCFSTALLMTSLTMKSNTGLDFWFLSVLQLGVWADLYVYCWYGNEVHVKSMRIPYAAFESNWVTASTSFKKDLLFFMLRSQKGIKIYAINFFELSLETFIGILRTAWSYYMLLRQLSKDK